MSHINTTTVSRAVIACLNAAATFQQRVADLRATLPGDVLADRDAVTRALRPGVAKFYGIDWAEHGKSGKFVTEDKAASTAARQALSRLVRAVIGEQHRNVEEVEVPAHIAKLAAQLVKACAKHEAASKLLATAIAQAKAAL